MNHMNTYLKVVVTVLCTSWYSQAQCEVFKSEISDVQQYMAQRIKCIRTI